MTYPALVAEYELCHAIDGEREKKCPRCGAETFQRHCSANCTLPDGEPLPLSGDAAVDKLKDREARGEAIDLNDPSLWAEIEEAGPRG